MQSPSPRFSGITRLFTGVVVVAVVGYVLFDRAFAWVHIPGVPLFWGEVVLLASALMILAHQRSAAELFRGSKVIQVSCLLFLWGLLRLVWDVFDYGILAARDAAMTNYILVAVAAGTAVVISKGRFYQKAESLARKLVPVVVIWAPVAVIVNRLFSHLAPRIPDSETSLLSFKPGDMAIWLAASITFVWLVRDSYDLGQRQALTVIGAIGLLVIASQNRGGAVTAIVMIGAAALLVDTKLRRRLVISLISGAAAVMILLSLLALAIPLGGREFSSEQLVENVASVAGGADPDSGLQGTVSWRLENWRIVVDDVLTGDQWLLGVGYGPNLADLYGFQTGPADTSQPLRNAHNSHVTLVARLGTVGLVLWIALWLQLGVLFYRSRRVFAHRGGAWLLVVALGIGVNAIFDPVLEGPQIAIPFWLIVGVLGGLEAVSTPPTHKTLRTRSALKAEETTNAALRPRVSPPSSKV